MRVAGGALVATAIAPWLGGAVAHAAKPSTPPPSGDNRTGVTSALGNATTCSDVGFGDDTLIGGGTGGYSQDGWDISTTPGSQPKYVDVNAVPSGMQIDALVVKGGNGYNLYSSHFFDVYGVPVSGLHAPLVGTPPKNIPTISHWFACVGQAPEFVAPTGSVTGDCSNATVNMFAGSNDANFIIDDGTTQTPESVPAGQHAQPVVIPWSGDTTITLSLDQGEDTITEIDHATRDAEACDVTTSAAPTVAFKNACKTGITVTLGNDEGTAAVIFTVTSQGSKQHVTVAPGQTKTVTVAVAEDTTGTVTVTAPGLEETSHSFAKNCTQVLGEKQTRPPTSNPPAVQGEQQQLPFTGLPTAMAAALAGLMLAVGVALTVAGRRRTARHAS